MFTIPSSVRKIMTIIIPSRSCEFFVIKKKGILWNFGSVKKQLLENWAPLKIFGFIAFPYLCSSCFLLDFMLKDYWICRHKLQPVVRPEHVIFLPMTFGFKDYWRAGLKPWQPVTWQIHTLWIMFTIQLMGPVNCIYHWHFGNGSVRLHLGEGTETQP